MRIEVISIFPEMIREFARHSLLGKALAGGLFELRVHDLRSVAVDPHRSVDDTPYGGGPGMVLAAPPIFETVEKVEVARPLLLLSPAGRKLDQRLLEELSECEGFSLLCGRYEGVDERVRAALIDDEISVGDYVLGGGEVAAMLVLEAVVRLLRGAMGNEESGAEESFRGGLLGHPHYTRPETYRGMSVPDVLRSGDHGRISRWRRAQALSLTLQRRPDLMEARGGLSSQERLLLEEFGLDAAAAAAPAAAPAAADPVAAVGDAAAEAAAADAGESGAVS